MQATSLEAYSKIIPKLPECQFIIWNLLRGYPQGLSNAEISYKLCKPINTITGRVYELRKLGYVKFYCKRKCTITGEEVMTWTACGESPQLRFF